MYTLHNDDFLNVSPSIQSGSVNLAILDLPYNISKAHWDKWKKEEDYIEWVGKVLLEVQRTLADNGSLYFFHNDMEQVAVIMEWIRKNTKFIFKQFIVWNKKFEGSWNQLNAVVSTDGLRNYSKQAEYILFYTFQDETGLTTVMLDTNNFSTLRKYFKEYQEALGMTKKQIIEFAGQKADHCFRWKSTQWDIPTPETYSELNNLPLKYEFVRREYEDLRREYEDLRREYEDLRYTFNNQNKYPTSNSLRHCLHSRPFRVSCRDAGTIYACRLSAIRESLQHVACPASRHSNPLLFCFQCQSYGFLFLVHKTTCPPLSCQTSPSSKSSPSIRCVAPLVLPCSTHRLVYCYGAYPQSRRHRGLRSTAYPFSPLLRRMKRRQSVQISFSVASPGCGSGVPPAKIYWGIRLCFRLCACLTIQR